MDFEQRDELRERNRRRANCAKCGGAARELTVAEIKGRDDLFMELRYAACGACGNTWRLRGARRWVAGQPVDGTR